jgi:aromatic ring-opening dioxygenase catalytic subunit (LigB family)
MAAGKEPVKTVEFLRSLGKQLLAEKNNVKALLVVSAHWESMGKNQLEITSFPGENPIIYGIKLK